MIARLGLFIVVLTLSRRQIATEASTSLARRKQVRFQGVAYRLERHSSSGVTGPDSLHGCEAGVRDSRVVSYLRNKNKLRAHCIRGTRDRKIHDRPRKATRAASRP